MHINSYKNDYINKPKNNCIETPLFLSEYLFSLVKDKISFDKENDIILDICCGKGNLSFPFYGKGYNVIGVDIQDCYGKFRGQFIQADFLEISALPIKNPKLILMNCPWNNKDNIRKNKRRVYLPEEFLKKIFNLYGVNVPIVMLTSWTLLMNQTMRSERFRWMREIESSITGVLNLPLDAFDGVKIWNHVLFFNVPGIKPCFFLPKETLI